MPQIRAIVISTDLRIPTLLEEYANKFQVEILINNSYQTFDDVSGSISTEEYDLAFLEFGTPELLSHKLVKELQKNTLIVGLFTSKEFITEAYMGILFSYHHLPLDVQTIENILTQYFTLQRVFQRRLSKSDAHKLLVPSISGFGIYDLDSIVRFEADGNYTKIYFKHNQSIVVSKPIKNFSRTIGDFRFVRVHNKHIINSDHIKMFSKGKKSHIQMSDGSLIPIAESKKQLFTDVINTITIKV